MWTNYANEQRGQDGTRVAFKPELRNPGSSSLTQLLYTCSLDHEPFVGRDHIWFTSAFPANPGPGTDQVSFILGADTIQRLQITVLQKCGPSNTRFLEF